MFRYRLHSPDGDDVGEATYAMMIKPGDEIIAGSNERFRVVDVVRFEEEDDAVRGAAASRGGVAPRLKPVLETYVHTNLRSARKSCAGLPTLPIDDAAREA